MVTGAVMLRGEARTEELRALAHDLRGAIGALGHQVQLLSSPAVAPEVRERSASVIEANLRDLHELLARLEALTGVAAESSER